ncbi:MAG: hypothetical protein ACK5Z5_04975 [Neisseriaceae bacterium]|jgi:hypothetical protein
MINILTISLICLAVLVIVLWLGKKYFTVNTDQMKVDIKYPSQEKRKVFSQKFPQTDGSISETKTESNNDLSRKRFDGVNINPEHSDNLNGG